MSWLATLQTVKNVAPRHGFAGLGLHAWAQQGAVQVFLSTCLCRSSFALALALALTGPPVYGGEEKDCP